MSNIRENEGLFTRCTTLPWPLLNRTSLVLLPHGRVRGTYFSGMNMCTDLRRHQPIRTAEDPRRARDRGSRKPEGERRRPQGSRGPHQRFVSNVPPGVPDCSARWAILQSSGRFRTTRSSQRSRRCSKVRPTARAVSFVNQHASFRAAYQTEIDNLTKRSKAAESAFLNVYKVFAEAPDPYPLLEAAVVCLCYNWARIVLTTTHHRTRP